MRDERLGCASRTPGLRRRDDDRDGGGRSDQQGGVPHEQRRRCGAGTGVVGVQRRVLRRVLPAVDGGRQCVTHIRGVRCRRRRRGDSAAGDRGRGVAVLLGSRPVVAARRGGRRRRGGHQGAHHEGCHQGRADGGYERPAPHQHHEPMVAQSGRVCTRCDRVLIEAQAMTAQPRIDSPLTPAEARTPQTDAAATGPRKRACPWDRSAPYGPMRKSRALMTSATTAVPRWAGHPQRMVPWLSGAVVLRVSKRASRAPGDARSA